MNYIRFTLLSVFMITSLYSESCKFSFFYQNDSAFESEILSSFSLRRPDGSILNGRALMPGELDIVAIGYEEKPQKGDYSVVFKVISLAEDLSCPFEAQVSISDDVKGEVITKYTIFSKDVKIGDQFIFPFCH